MDETYARCVPFWIVELIGLFVTDSFTVKKYVLDFIFLMPATGYGWFMGYIVICYSIFYVIKKLVKNDKNQMLILFAAFLFGL